MSKLYPINTKVWFFDNYGTLQSGIIQNTVGICEKYYEIHLTDGGTMGVRVENCHLSRQKAIQTQTEKEQKQIQEYKNSIHTIDDLVAFCLTFCCAHAEEYTNYQARQAAIEKAKELGIRLPDTIS